MSWGQGGAGRVVGDRESNNSQLASNEGGRGGSGEGVEGGGKVKYPEKRREKRKNN